MAAASDVPPPPVAAPQGPIVACPYTAGGCPLFQTYDIDEGQRCAGSCSPAPPPPPPAFSPRAGPSSSSVKRPATSLLTAEDAAFLSELAGEGPGVSLSSPATAALLHQDSSWSPYLDFGISPGQLDMSVMAPLAGPSTSTSAGSPSTLADALPPQLRPQLWDLEDLLADSHDSKRTRKTPPPPPVPSGAAIPVAEYPHTDVQVDGQSQMAASAAASGSPTSTDESDETEVVTPFISKLSYLLQHGEYEPWVRWDSSGQWLLVAHTKPHLLHILERFFRHTVTSSFIRQLNIYGFRRASTAQLLNILDSTTFASSVSLPDGSVETFSAADFSAFGNPLFFRSVPGGPTCRLGALKPITKERGPRNRGKKAQQHAAAAAAAAAASGVAGTGAGGGKSGGSRRRSGELATPSATP